MIQDDRADVGPTGDAAKLSSEVRGKLPGSEKEAKTELKLHGEEFGKKVDDAVCFHHNDATDNVPPVLHICID